VERKREKALAWYWPTGGWRGRVCEYCTV